jgi:DNA-directed RNA polymerase specialized sigma24 family protein
LQVYALIGDFAEAQDVVHEAFARVLVRPGRLDNPEAWLRARCSKRISRAG